MRYRDLFALPSEGALENLHPPEPKQHCLIWSENHEHAVASIDDEIHTQAKRVWLGFEDPNWCSHPVIYAYERHWRTSDWELVERKKGNTLVNNNPFKPDSESVFPIKLSINIERYTVNGSLLILQRDSYHWGTQCLR